SRASSTRSGARRTPGSSRTASSRSGTTTRGGSGRAPAPNRSPRRTSRPLPPVKRPKQRGLVVTSANGVGRGIAAMWRVTARGAGAAARVVGHSVQVRKDIEIEYRRDGLGLGLLALAVVCAIGSWFRAAGPVGRTIDDGVRVWMGTAALALPVFLLVAAIVLMRTAADRPHRVRRVSGWIAVTVAVTGIFHVAQLAGLATS